MTRTLAALLLVLAPAGADPLVQAAERAIAKIRARPLRSDKHTPWVVMHGVIAFEKDRLVRDRKTRVNAVEYLLTRAEYGGKRIFRDVDGAPVLPQRGGLLPSFKVQDHVDQFLMAFADAGVGLDARIVADSGTKFTLRDLLAASQHGFEESQELGWTLVAYTDYVGFFDTWTAGGKKYALMDAVRLAIARDPKRETEGGTHHLYGVGYALRRYREKFRDVALEGVWQDAATYLARYVRLAERHQQEDGAFSVKMFRGSARPRSPSRLVWSTGHMLEWLAVACEPKVMRRKWMRRAVARLAREIEERPLKSFRDGGMYHAAHALRLWRKAVITAPAAR